MHRLALVRHRPCSPALDGSAPAPAADTRSRGVVVDTPAAVRAALADAGTVDCSDDTRDATSTLPAPLTSTVACPLPATWAASLAAPLLVAVATTCATALPATLSATLSTSVTPALNAARASARAAARPGRL